MDEFSNLPESEQVERLRQLAAVALRDWGFEDADLELIKIRENAVYMALRPNGERYIVRVHRAGYHTDAELTSEFQWMQALNEAGISTPPVIPTKSGERFTHARVDSVPQQRQVDVLGVVAGEPLGTIEGGIEADSHGLGDVFAKVGAMAAQLHNQAETWNQPDGFVRGAFDLDGLTGENPHWGRFLPCPFLSDAEGETIRAAADKLRRELEVFGTAPDRFGLIHADLLPENFLVAGERTNLIDFDDAAFGWHLFDLATPLFFHLGKPYFDDAVDALVRGYRQHRELPDEHLGMLPAFLFARGLAYLGWLKTRSETSTGKELGPVVAAGVHELAQAYLAEA